MNFFRTTIYASVFGIMISGYNQLYSGAGGLGFPGNGGFPTFSEQDLKELEEFNKFIEQQVANELTPEQQAQFYKDVDELTQVFSTMSPEELDKFMGDFFADQTPPPPPVPSVAQSFAKVEEVEVPKLSGEQKQKIATILMVLDDIIKQSHMFLLQVSISSNFSTRIEKWGKNNLIPHWQPNLTWNAFKLAIEELVNKLILAKEQDPKTKAYKYLLGIIEDESLFNSLAQLQTSLNLYVPQIEVPEIAEKLSSPSKEALQKTCDKLAESLYVLNLSKAFDELFLKFEPEAIKLREAEEMAAARALEESRYPGAPGYVVQAGVEPIEGYGGGYSDYGYNPYAHYAPSYEPQYRPSYEPSYQPETTGSRASGGKGGAAPSKGSTEKEETKEKDKKKKDADKKKAEEKDKELEINQEVERLLAQVSVLLDEIKESIYGDDADKRLSTIDTYVTNKEQKVDDTVVEFVLRTLFSLKKKIEKAKNTVKKIKRKICAFKGKTLDHYKKELSKVTNEYKKLKEFAEKIALISYDTPTQKKKLGNRKRWAFFADKEALEKIKAGGSETVGMNPDGTATIVTGEQLATQLESAIPNPVDLRAVGASINEIFEDIDCIKDIKEETPVKEEKKTKKKKTPAPIPGETPQEAPGRVFEETELTKQIREAAELTPEQQEAIRKRQEALKREGRE